MDDVIKLVTTTYTYDEAGNTVETSTSRTVYCDVYSVTRSEYYAAAQVDLHPEYLFRLTHYKDYQNEKTLIYKDWLGNERTYNIIRAYRLPDSDALELTTAERVGNG